MRKVIAQTLSLFSGIAALSVVAAVFWYVFGDLPNLMPADIPSGFGLVAPILRWFFGLAVYMLSGTAIVLLLTASSRIVLVGWVRFLEEEREQSAKAKKESIREVGTFLAVSVDSGGLLDSATSMIETTDGFYRVFGRVDAATKGAKVTIQREFRGFFTIKWLCLGGKRFQMTK